MVIGSTDDERRFDEWLTAVRVGLGVPVDVFDLRTPA
jgi:hypothetical protein